VNLFKRVWYDNDDDNGDDDDAAVVVVGALSTAISWSNSLCKCSCMESPGSVRRRFGDNDDNAAVVVAVAAGDIDNNAVDEGSIIPAVRPALVPLAGLILLSSSPVAAPAGRCGLPRLLTPPSSNPPSWLPLLLWLLLFVVITITALLF